jgi:hypothetical protein
MSAIGLSIYLSFCHLCQSILYAGYSPVQFSASERFHVCYKSYLLLLVDCSYLSVNTRHIYLCRPLPSNHLLSWTEYCHISVVSLVMSCGTPFLLGCTVPQQLIFCLVRSSNKSVEERSCLCTAYVHIFLPFFVKSVCCHICSHSCPVLP